MSKANIVTNRLHSASDGVVAEATEIFDAGQDKFQDELNAAANPAVRKGILVVDTLTKRPVLPCWYSTNQTVYFKNTIGYIAQAAVRVRDRTAETNKTPYVIFGDEKMISGVQTAFPSNDLSHVSSVQFVVTLPAATTAPVYFFRQVHATYIAIDATGKETNVFQQIGDGVSDTTPLPVGTVRVRIEATTRNLKTVLWAPKLEIADRLPHGAYRCVEGATTRWEPIPIYTSQVQQKGCTSIFDVTTNRVYGRFPSILREDLRPKGMFSAPYAKHNSINPFDRSMFFCREGIDISGVVLLIRRRTSAYHSDYGHTTRTAYVAPQGSNISILIDSLYRIEAGSASVDDRKAGRYLLSHTIEGNGHRDFHVDFIDIALAFRGRNRKGDLSDFVRSPAMAYYRLSNHGGGVWSFEMQ